MNLRLKKKKNKKYCNTLWHDLYACIDEAMDYGLGKRRKAQIRERDKVARKALYVVRMVDPE